MARSNQCPRCGATVSQFAAGCSICGADLEAMRRQKRRRVSTVVQLPYDAREFFEGTVVTLVMVIVALFAPLYGMALAALVFFDRRRHGHRTMRNLAAACFLLAALSFFVPGLPYGQLPPVASGG
jgi:hypothetical protein